MFSQTIRNNGDPSSMASLTHHAPTCIMSDGDGHIAGLQDGCTPLMAACRAAFSSRLVRVLIDNGAIADAIEGIDTSTFLWV